MCDLNHGTENTILRSNDGVNDHTKYVMQAVEPQTVDSVRYKILYTQNIINCTYSLKTRSCTSRCDPTKSKINVKADEVVS